MGSKSNFWIVSLLLVILALVGVVIAEEKITGKDSPDKNNPKCNCDCSKNSVQSFFDSWNTSKNEWNPLQELQEMERRMSAMMHSTLSNMRQSPDFKAFTLDSFSSPKVDLKEEEDKYIVTADMPGANKGRVSASVEDNVLIINANREENKQRKDPSGKVLLEERSSGSFSRQIPLPSPVDESGMQSTFENGVLTVTIPKRTS